MKVKLEIELDLEGTRMNAASPPDLSCLVQEMSSWLDHLHQYNYSRLMESWDVEDEKMWEAVHRGVKEDILLSKQIFHQFRLSGQTDDGHEFEFRHQEPGYLETFTLDGQQASLSDFRG